MGRWIDFKNDYKTLDPTFMESVWWVFQQLHEKGLVFRGFKVMPFSTACSTPLSNFEAQQNYKEVRVRSESVLICSIIHDINIIIDHRSFFNRFNIDMSTGSGGGGELSYGRGS